MNPEKLKELAARLTALERKAGKTMVAAALAQLDPENRAAIERLMARRDAMKPKTTR